MSRIIKTINTYRADVGAFEKNAHEDNANYYLFRISERDEHGRTLLERELQPNGRPFTETTYTYQPGAEGKVLSKETRFHHEDTSEKLTYTYDDKGRLLNEAVYFDGELYENTEYTYDEKGNVILQSRKDEEESLIESQENEYDSEGRQIRMLRRNAEGETEHELTRSYDENGHITEEINITPEQGRTRNVFAYNENGDRILSQVYNDKDEMLGQVEVEYDSNNKPVKYSSETWGYQTSHMINQVTYDDEGRIIENEYYDVLNGFMLSKEVVSFTEDGNISTEEVFEVQPNASMKKNHFRVQHQYDFYEMAEENKG